MKNAVKVKEVLKDKQSQNTKPVIEPRVLRRIVGDNIRCLRGELQLSQFQLGVETGLSQDFIGRLERGQVNIGIDNVAKLSVALHIDPQYLFIHNYCFEQVAARKSNPNHVSPGFHSFDGHAMDGKLDGHAIDGHKLDGNGVDGRKYSDRQRK